MLYIMRHGKTEWNELQKLQGRTDIPLSDAGRAMARQAQEEYRELHFDICYTSPLLRARETAEILLEGRQIPIVTDERLVEMSFGSFEGVQNYWGTPDSPIRFLFQHPEMYTESVGGAETFAELFQRTGAFLEEVVQPRLERGEDVLIVAHGATNCSIISAIRSLPIEQFWSAGVEQCKILAL